VFAGHEPKSSSDWLSRNGHVAQNATAAECRAAPSTNNTTNCALTAVQAMVHCKTLTLGESTVADFPLGWPLHHARNPACWPLEN